MATEKSDALEEISQLSSGGPPLLLIWQQGKSSAVLLAVNDCCQSLTGQMILPEVSLIPELGLIRRGAGRFDIRQLRLPMLEKLAESPERKSGK